jgi:hypothetical protein
MVAQQKKSEDHARRRSVLSTIHEKGRVLWGVSFTERHDFMKG